MAYELFVSSNSSSSEPFISLVKEGFRFSAAFLKKNRLERASAVRVYFDQAKGAIGFHFFEEHRKCWEKARAEDQGWVLASGSPWSTVDNGRRVCNEYRMFFC